MNFDFKNPIFVLTCLRQPNSKIIFRFLLTQENSSHHKNKSWIFSWLSAKHSITKNSFGFSLDFPSLISSRKFFSENPSLLLTLERFSGSKKFFEIFLDFGFSILYAHTSSRCELRRIIILMYLEDLNYQNESACMIPCEKCFKGYHAHHEKGLDSWQPQGNLRSL